MCNLARNIRGSITEFRRDVQCDQEVNWVTGDWLDSVNSQGQSMTVGPGEKALAARSRIVQIRSEIPLKVRE